MAVPARGVSQISLVPKPAFPTQYPDFNDHVKIEVLTPGNGKDFPVKGNTVEVHYVGKIGNFPNLININLSVDSF